MRCSLGVTNVDPIVCCRCFLLKQVSHIEHDVIFATVHTMDTSTGDSSTGLGQGLVGRCIYDEIGAEEF